MSLNQLVSAKYIFIDVVDYTDGRPSEAQIDITTSLNKIVKESIADNKIDPQAILFIPTGDGVCIVLKNISYEQFDAHLRLALTILRKLYEYNRNCNDKKRQYAVRIGLNENIDNIVIDINGNVNVSGAGINNCQRIMDFAAANQIMVGPQVHEILSKREKFFEYFRCFEEVAIKNSKMNIYQYIDDECEYLSSEFPPDFLDGNTTEKRIPEITAHFLVLLHRNKERIVQLRSETNGDHFRDTMIVAFWFLANDALRRSKSMDPDQLTPFSPSQDLDELVQRLDETDARVVCELSGFISGHTDFSYSLKQFAEEDGSLFLNKRGLEKLHQDWPDLTRDLGSGADRLPAANDDSR